MGYEKHIFAGIYCATSLVAFFMNLLVVMSNISHLSKLPPSPLMHIQSAQRTFVLNLIKLADAALLTFGCGMTLVLCLCLTLFRYFAIVGRTKVSKILAKRLILVCVLMSTAVALHLEPQSLILEPSETYCLVNWASKRTTTLWLIAVILVWIGIPILVIGWAYHCIYAKFQVSVDYLSNGKKIKSGSSTNVPSNLEKKSNFAKVATGNTEEEQRNLLYQSMISTSTLPSPLIDFLCVYCVIFNQLANPMLVLYFNRIISDKLN
ncbi:hypothetical protein BCR33DRAFT_719534 [Rhizoclosmatium globosum]|uniref:G-protein coupled receptors family 1 profile domain-containing protein n=1 Tax=Rhizoclosmatium globosum TaxID=329046 RepID=A0A1Y2BZE3_9FUNG|nr:hypothetical protein BCR33DRAFT_719534 [Rhizoclosmatium globosum]|eukprot:ORY40131.1 hypothetical protein BCR33DRAFT_719534 [Rhizoclosmatium globosum]